MFAEEPRGFVEVRDARADIEALPAAIVLPHQGLAHDHGVERHHESADGEAVDGRRGDQAHLADAGKGELEGAGDRRGGEGQHMDIRPHAP